MSKSVASEPASVPTISAFVLPQPLELKSTSAHTVAVSSAPAFEIRSTTSTDWGALISMIGSMLITALIVMITSKVTLKSNNTIAETMENTARDQRASDEARARSERISASRQAWINALRDSLADFISSLKRLDDLNQQTQRRAHSLSYRTQPINHEQLREEIRLSNELRNQLLAEASRSLAKIRLQLNPDEQTHRTLEAEITSALEGALANEQVQESCDRIVELARPILKQTWESVKRGE